MATSVPHEGTSLPPGAGSGAASGPSALDRLASFRVTYVAVFAFLLLYVFTVAGLEHLLSRHFRGEVAAAVRVDPGAGDVVQQIQSGVDAVVKRSPWVRAGDVRVQALVFGADGTPIYYGAGNAAASPTTLDPLQALEEAQRLLPARASVSVTVPHNSLLANGILVLYAGALLSGLFFYNRALARREEQRISEAVQERDRAAQRAGAIEDELERIRDRMGRLDAAEAGHVGEIRQLHGERAALQRQLAELARREEELRTRASQATDLDQEREALEELLEEALREVQDRDQSIQDLQSRLTRAARETPRSGGGRSRELEQLGRRLRTLYKNLEVDDRALKDMLALRDEAMKLKAEEAVKRLSDEAENAAVRRKVGGLPAHLNVFELGFAGKGRIYYTHGTQRRFRILCVGAKNSQKTDLEYLSRLPR